MFRRVARYLHNRATKPDSLEGQSITLEIISGQNLAVPSERIPASIYVSIKPDQTRCWKSGVRVLSSDKSVAWGDTVTLLSHVSPKLSVEIRASFELGRTLGNGELIGKRKTSWDKLLAHGNEPFDLSFPPVRGVRPSLRLKVAFVHACGNDDSGQFDSIIDCETTRRTDAGHARYAEYVASRSVSHLNDAVEDFQFILERCPVGHPDRAAALTNLAWARLKGYARKDLQDIDSTTSLFRDALALRPQDHPNHPFSVYCLTEALNWRYDRECATADISESAQLYHDLLPLCPEGTHLRSIAVGKDGVDYAIDGCNYLPVDASDADIHLRRIVLELCPPGHQHRSMALNKLGRALSIHFEQSGSIDDIDESIQLLREALSLCPEEHLDRGDYLNDLAVSLRYRFDYQGKSHDLDEAISLYEESLSLHPVGHGSHDIPLDNLGSALHTRFNRCGDINDINKAISFSRETLTLRPPGHQHHDTALNNLAFVLKTRYDKLNASGDLNEAIELCRESLQSQTDAPWRHRYLYGLSSALCARFAKTQKNEDVEEAIGLCQESLAILSPLHPDRHFSYMALKDTYLSRYQVQHNPTDLSLTVENFRLGSRHPTQGFPERIILAYNWTIVAEMYSDASALEAYTISLELLDAHLSTRSSTTSRREAAAAFHNARSLSVNAASGALRRDNIRKAVELVEQGRGQQWSLASRLRTPVEDLELAHPKLAHKFLELSARISNAAQGSAAITDRAAADLAAREYRRLTEQWETAVNEIRNNQGFARFLLPPLYEDLQAAACQGPVIILIASRYSCDAIIVPKSGEPRHVPFSSLVLADLVKLKDDFARAIRHASIMGPEEPRKDLIVLLRKIWEEIMLPVADVLQHDLKLRHRSRIWLCPTAAFTSIPLHAAHPSRTKADRSGREPCLADLYICSYTPTLSALIRSRQTMKTRATPSFVAIGQGRPGAGQGTELATVDSELELVCKLIPATANPTTLSGDAATRAGALEALQQNTWVHLACHGKQDREQPYHSRFSMRDKPLTLLDIMENNAPHAEFAFLSACHTAVGDEETPDEVIHLVAGLQFSGFKSVIGTLWVVDDGVAKHVVEAFYENMFKAPKEGAKEATMDCTKAALALNKATSSVKKKVPLEQRIVFIHIGV
ncbi:CHAT domain-containing protein [Suillus paluster]|uniref:CHAT domain-containing protein n=1 Tax=Suillus paluster TaxID=48578 RepID=UPI001B86F94E|nr:CHAT domain-containing protein [Suillus paluster]KAG1738607.1 CHAT domain-containing protein [Suillus paluster]